MGQFREELYCRLNVVVVQVPPLRARLEDVRDLATHFLKVQADVYDESVKHLTPDATASLSAYGWLCNVRELANVIENELSGKTDEQRTGPGLSHAKGPGRSCFPYAPLSCVYAILGWSCLSSTLPTSTFPTAARRC